MIKVSFNVYHEPDSRFPTNDVLYQHNMEKIGKMIENIDFSNRASFFFGNQWHEVFKLTSNYPRVAIRKLWKYISILLDTDPILTDEKS